VAPRPGLATAAWRAFLWRHAAATLLGVAVGFTRLDPIKALFYAAVVNGVISVPIMVVMMRMASNPGIMGQFVVKRRLHILGWAATASWRSPWRQCWSRWSLEQDPAETEVRHERKSGYLVRDIR
jgi:hypothetical protein